MILDETRERFIKAIVAQVDVSRIAEIHFFAPIKQGGVESGVAVVAAWPEVVVAAAPAEQTDAADAAPVNHATERHVVYMARYRHTLKDPDRGKWETNVVAEADAPLVTVDAVVRGVQRRSGDVDDPIRMEGDDVRAFVQARAAAAAARGAG